MLAHYRAHKLARDTLADLPAKHCRYGDLADLEILAVHPEFQRKGFGQALLESVLRAADRDNLPVYLEASASESFRGVATGLWSTGFRPEILY